MDGLGQCIFEEGYEEGYKIGYEEGYKIGYEQGYKIGYEEGLRKVSLMTLCDLVNDGLLKLEEAARRMDLSEEEFCEEMKRVGY